MKRFTKILGAAALAVLPVAQLNAEGLEINDCSLKAGERYRPVEVVSVLFSGNIEVKEGCKAVITRNGETVATAIPDNAGGTAAPSELMLRFDNTALETGQHYVFTLPEGSVCAADNPPTVNPAYTVSFEIPSDLGAGHFPNVAEIASTTKETFRATWPTELTAVGSPEWTLRREGVAVRKVPALVANDWDLGTVYADFTPAMNFEKGVNYSIELPAGSVCAAIKELVNLPTELNFTGDYAEALPPIDYVWCSLYTDRPDGQLNLVSFYYDRAVMLGQEPTVELRYGDDEQLLKAVVPSLGQEDGRWVLTADFEGYPIDNPEGYSIVIPEGTLISADGDVVVNHQNTIDLSSSTSLAERSTAETSVTAASGAIRIAGLRPGSTVVVATPDGRTLYAGRAASCGTLTVPVASAGLYLVVADGRPFRLLVK